MRAVSELVGRLVLMVSAVWLGTIMVTPADLRPVIACEPLVWATRSLGQLIGSAAGTAAPPDQTELLGGFEQGCLHAMAHYFHARSDGP